MEVSLVMNRLMYCSQPKNHLISFSLLGGGVDAQFCIHNLIKKNDLNDHQRTLKIMIALHESVCSCITCINLSLHS